MLQKCYCADLPLQVQEFAQDDEDNDMFTAREQSLRQGNVFTLLCHYFHRGEGSLSRGLPDKEPPPQRPRLDRDPPGHSLPPPRCDKERMVRILLECILVFFVISDVMNGEGHIFFAILLL